MDEPSIIYFQAPLEGCVCDWKILRLDCAHQGAVYWSSCTPSFSWEAVSATLNAGLLASPFLPGPWCPLLEAIGDPGRREAGFCS